MRLLFDIAVSHLAGRLRQSVVSVLGVATGVGFFIAIAALMQGSQRDFVETVIEASPHVVMKDEFRAPPPQPLAIAEPEAAVMLEGLKPRDELRGIRNPRARLVEIEAMPGVAAAPTLSGQVVLRYGGKDLAASLLGIEPELERRVSQIEDDITSGRLDDLRTAAGGIIVGSGIARRLGVRAGDTVIAVSPAGVVRRMKVVGTFHTGIVAIDDSQAYALLKEVQVLLDRPHVVNEIRLRLDDIGRAREIARLIERRYGYLTESWDEANEGILEVFVVRNIIIYAVTASILLVAGFGIFNIITTVTFEKVRDIAILKSLGFTRRDILLIFVAEGLVFGAAGALLGSLLGYALCRALGAIRIEVGMFTEMTRLPLYESPLFYAIACAFALGSAGLAAWIPARKAARVNPVDIIRGAA